METEKGDKNRKLISAEEGYFAVNNDESMLAFSALRNFLIRFKRPFRDCYVQVPNHSEIEEREEFLPLDVYYKTPQYPLIHENNMFKVVFDEKSFHYVHEYCFGFKFEDRHLIENFEINFSIKCFCGFLLQY